MTTKKFKVIKILSDTTLIGNMTKDDDIHKDDAFKIVGNKDVKIEDPETGELLGYLGGEKGVVYVSEIHDKFAILKSEFVESYTTEPFFKSTSPSIMQNFFESHEVPAHFKELNVDYGEIEDSISEEPIKIGDTLEKIE